MSPTGVYEPSPSSAKLCSVALWTTSAGPPEATSGTVAGVEIAGTTGGAWTCEEREQVP